MDDIVGVYNTTFHVWFQKATGNSPTTDQRGEFCNFDISEWKLWLLWRSPAQWYGRAAPYNSFFDVRHPLISGFHPSAIEIVFYSIYFHKFISFFSHLQICVGWKNLFFCHLGWESNWATGRLSGYGIPVEIGGRYFQGISTSLTHKQDQPKKT